MKIAKVQVENMRSPRTGNPVANQFNIIVPKGRYFQSYDTIIAFRDNEGKVYLDKDSWDYSVTTGKYRNEFLGECIAETRKKIEDKTYILKDLN